MRSSPLTGRLNTKTFNPLRECYRSHFNPCRRPVETSDGHPRPAPRTLHSVANPFRCHCLASPVPAGRTDVFSKQALDRRERETEVRDQRQSPSCHELLGAGVCCGNALRTKPYFLPNPGILSYSAVRLCCGIRPSAGLRTASPPDRFDAGPRPPPRRLAGAISAPGPREGLLFLRCTATSAAPFGFRSWNVRRCP